MPLKRGTWILAAICASLVTTGGLARAEDKPAVDPRAERILKAAVANLSALKAYTFRGESITEMQLPSGQRIQYAGTIRAAVRRPDRVWTSVEGEQGRKANWYDGKTLTHFNGEQKAYAVWQAPATTDELFDTMKEKLGFVPPLASLMRTSIDKDARKGIQSGFYAGPAVVDGHACSHLAFRSDNVDWQVWVDDVVPVIRRVVLSYKKVPGNPQLAVTFTDWDFNATLPDSVFVFDPPAGATKVEFEIVKQ